MKSLESKILGAALSGVRRLLGLTAREMAEVVGTSEDMISAYERGSKNLTRVRYLELGLKAGFTVRRLEAVRLGLKVDAWELVGLPGDEETRERWFTAEVTGLVASRTSERAMRLKRLERKVRHERAEAKEVCRRLLRLPEKVQGAWVALNPACRHWAVIERLCEMSEAVASAKPARALQLAGWAKQAAEASPETPDKPRKVGYAGFFYANALRVVDDLKGADSELAVAWEMWKKGDVSDGPPFAHWRPHDLAASLRIDQELWDAAVNQSDQALALAPAGAHARILLKKASGLQFGGASDRAVKVLGKAVALVDAEREPRLAFAAHFTFAACLHDLGQVGAAGDHLATAYALAVALENDLDLARCDWLGGKLAIETGRQQNGLAAFARARETFASHRQALDCAAVSLDEAIVLLECGDWKRVKRIATSVAWIFNDQGIAREGREALLLFCQATAREEATVDQARQALEVLRGRSAPSTHLRKS